MKENGIKRVLVVDDHNETCLILQALLQSRGYDVETASSGRSAVTAWEMARAAGRPFCAILCDIAMPDMTGYEVTEYVRNNQVGNGTPVVLMTGYDEPLVAAHAQRSKADEVIYKPPDMDHLLERIEKLCRVKGELDQIRTRLMSGESLSAADKRTAETHLRQVWEDRDLSQVRRAAALHMLTAIRSA